MPERMVLLSMFYYPVTTSNLFRIVASMTTGTNTSMMSRVSIALSLSPLTPRPMLVRTNVGSMANF